MKKQRILLVVRHLTTQDNIDQLFSSGDRDIPILPGQSVSENITTVLKKFPTDNLLVVHTGLQRTFQTAELLKQSFDNPKTAVVIPEFKERIGGQLAGLPFTELQHLFPKLVSPNQLWMVEALDVGLETAEEFLGRIKNGLEKIRLLVSNNNHVLLVAHAGTIKGIKAVLTERELDKQKQILCEPTPSAQEILQLSFCKKGKNHG